MIYAVSLEAKLTAWNRQANGLVMELADNLDLESGAK